MTMNATLRVMEMRRDGSDSVASKVKEGVVREGWKEREGKRKRETDRKR